MRLAPSDETVALLEDLIGLNRQIASLLLGAVEREHGRDWVVVLRKDERVVLNVCKRGGVVQDLLDRGCVIEASAFAQPAPASHMHIIAILEDEEAIVRTVERAPAQPPSSPRITVPTGHA